MVAPAVLYVDDEPLLLEVWGRIFRMLGVDAVAAASVREAIEVLEGQEFDVLITDLRMPEEDGTVLLDHVVNNIGRKMDLFVCTGYLDEKALDTCNAFEVVRLISKPFSLRKELEYFRSRLSVAD